jgi:hypothetical protein
MEPSGVPVLRIDDQDVLCIARRCVDQEEYKRDFQDPRLGVPILDSEVMMHEKRSGGRGSNRRRIGLHRCRFRSSDDIVALPVHREHLLTVIIVEWIPDQRAMVCRNLGSLGYRLAEEYLRIRPYNFAWLFRRRWNKP